MQLESPELYCRKSFKSICKKHRDFEKTYEQSLASAVGYILDPAGVNQPPQLVSLYQCDEYQFWKLKGVVIKGLKPSQWPRLWFGIDLAFPPRLIPLALEVHKTGYQDNEVEQDAHRRLLNHLGLGT